ncbi:MAG: hypothetical protein KDE58_28195, partial [Caldilineaceae bacterium]|nr:hypothetical protein [Caldilineaceae bacterium]
MRIPIFRRETSGHFHLTTHILHPWLLIIFFFALLTSIFAFNVWHLYAQATDTVSTADAPGTDTTATVTICHYPVGNRNNPQTLTIPVDALPAHDEHQDILGPCTMPTTATITPTRTVTPAAAITSTVILTSTEAMATTDPVTTTVIPIATIIPTATVALSAIDTPTVTIISTATMSVAGSSGHITICHRPPGNPSQATTITIGVSALAAHLEHDDAVGSCVPTSMVAVVITITPGVTV